MTRHCSLIVLAFLVSISGLAHTIRVPLQQPTIQAGIDAANHGDTVLVSHGIYYENVNFKGKAIVVASLMLLDSDSSHRDETIIDGSMPDCPDSGSVVLFVSGEDTSSVLYGFVITGGTGTLFDPNARIGGGICLFASSARIARNRITNNSAIHCHSSFGGGIGSYPQDDNHYVIIEDNLVESNSLIAGIGVVGGGISFGSGRIVRNTIRQNVITACTIEAGGGGIAATCDTISGRTSISITGNIITGNEAASAKGYEYGGGVFVRDCDVTLQGNLISSNQLRGGMGGDGGGVAIVRSTGGSLITDNAIVSNSAGVVGESGGGGLAILSSRGVTVERNRIERNDARVDGGGVFCNQSCSILVRGNVIQRNHAIYGGGVSSCGDVVLVNNIFVENHAQRGGALSVFQVPPLRGATHVTNNTITLNTADICAGGIYALYADVRIMNTICYGNSAPRGAEVDLQGGEVHIAYSDLRFGADSITVCDNGRVDWVAGNISVDPSFLDTTCRLADSSPCIGAGIDSLTIDGDWCQISPTCPRGLPCPNPPGSRPDIGAYESPLGKPLGAGIGDLSADVPDGYLLEQNYPNPFNAATVIKYTVGGTRGHLPAGQAGGLGASSVRLVVYELLGREVAMLVNERKEPGTYHVTFGASGLASGVYLCRMTAGDFVQSRKLVLVR